MADESGEKSEAPTGKRISQARGEGQVGKSQDLSQILSLTAAFYGLQIVCPNLWNDLLIVFHGALSGENHHSVQEVPGMHGEFAGLLLLLLPDILLLFVIAAFFGAGCTAAQTKFLWSNKLLWPKFSKLNPVQGLKSLLSLRNAFNLWKSIAKLAVICPIAYMAFFDIFPGMLALMDVPITSVLTFTGEAASTVFWRIAPVLFIIALLDFSYQKWDNHKKMKMAKHEVKDERKATEGDEKTKLQIRQKGLQRIRDRMMDAVPGADVVVTNPTHIAVALKYDMTPGSAPMVVAKGRGYVAERIKKLAKENRIPVLERKALARALYNAVELGQSIPYELYAAVADLLAYVYKLKGVTPKVKKQTAQR